MPIPPFAGRNHPSVYEITPDPIDSQRYPITVPYGLFFLNALDADLQNYSLLLSYPQILAEAKTFMFNSTLSCEVKRVDSVLELSSLTSGYTWGNIYLI